MNDKWFSAAPSYPPSTVEVLDVFSSNFTVEWTPPPEHAHNGIIRSYLLNITELETGRVLSRETTGLQWAIAHLHPYYTYLFTVAAVTVSAGPPTQAMLIITLETGELCVHHVC